MDKPAYFEAYGSKQDTQHQEVKANDQEWNVGFIIGVLYKVYDAPYIYYDIRHQHQKCRILKNSLFIFAFIIHLFQVFSIF